MSDSEPKRNEDRQRKILQAADELISYYGYDKTTMSDIAQKAGISKGALYLHFDSKEALFEALLLDQSERVLDDTIARIEADPNGGSFFALYSHMLTAAAHNPFVRALMSQNRRILGDYVQQLVNSPLYEQTRGTRIEMIQQLQAKGMIRNDVPPQMVMYFLNLIRQGLAQGDALLSKEDIPPLETFAPILAEFLTRALAPPDSNGGEMGKQTIRHFLEMSRTQLKTFQQHKK
ncbi:MAG: TetR/AcrR family transcriptional regulator [Anaerolineae bacterium]|jgi:TetR/AcrR family acrAB operon transcriptional repressor|nr:TetR/AcrR family transcriptional regulator [Anaerolineae bacterium]